jgi:ABC-2 type transport system permease protein
MLLLNEWRYLNRQPLLWLACIVLPLIAYVFAIGTGSIDTLADKRLQALHMTLLMLSLPLLSGAFAPLVFLRDQNNHMSELILVTPQSPFQRLFARLMLMFSVCAGLLLLSFVIMWFMLSLSFGWHWSLFALTLWDFVFMALPACALFSALASCLAQRFTSSVVIYVTFCAIWLSYIVLASMTGSPMLAGSSIISPWLFASMRLFDPFGITALLVYYQSSDLWLYGDVVFYLNRLAYCLVAAGLFYLSIKLKPYSVAHILPPKDIAPKALKAQTYQFVSQMPDTTQQLLQLIYLDVSTLLKQRLSQIILFGWTLLMFNEILSGINYAEPLSIVNPTSLDALNRISDDVLPLMGSLLILLWSWQLCWRNRRNAMAELIAAAPVRSGILMLSNVIALSSLVLLLMVLTSAACLLAELVAGSELQATQYFIQLSMAALPLILLGAIFTALHTLFRSPLVALAWCVGILVMKFTPLSGTLGISHTMWNIAASPLQPADAFWGLEQSLSVYWPFMCFWILFTFTLLWMAAMWSHRTTSFTNRQRGKLSLGSTALLALTLATGYNLHSNIISEKPLMNSDLREQWRTDYEQKYAEWATISQPVISHIDSQVDIYPQAGVADFSLTYTLENRTEHVIDRLLIGSYASVPIDDLKVSITHRSEYDPQLGQTVVTLSKAMAPGDSLTLWTKLSFKQPQHWPAVMHQMVKPSFSYLRGVPLLPTVGFQPQYQLRDEQLRQEYGLAPLNLDPPSRLFADAKSTQASYDWASMHSIISTNAEQVPLAQGQLVKNWQVNGRNYAEYQTAEPIRQALVWFSLPQHSIKRQSGSTLLAVYSPENSAAADLNMQAMLDTLNWMTNNIAPYRGNTLSLIASPDFGSTGYALPQMIMIDHRVGFRALPAKDAGFDQRYRRAVHETAHQWFGHDLGNGVLEDGAFLVESLAKYIELVLIEQRDGVDAMQAIVDYERQRYKAAITRSTERTKALIDATENHDMYSRATLVFAILRDKLGDDVICQTLRILWQQHAYPKPPATSMDFVRILKSQVNPEQQMLVDELLLGTDIAGLL